jgi:hypothetical protein
MQPSRDFQLLGAATGGGLRGEPWARLAGRRADGASVAVTVRGLRPFFYLKLEHGLLLPDGTPNQPLLDALVVDLNRHLNSRCRPDQKPAADYVSHFLGYALLRSAVLVQRHDFYGFSALKHHYARLTFASLGAHREARWALGAPAGSAKAGPPLRSHVLERVWPARVEDLSRAYRRADNVRRKGLAFTLAEANIEFHDQVMDELRLKPGCWCTPGPALLNACSFDDCKADRVATTLSLTAAVHLDGPALRAALAGGGIELVKPSQGELEALLGTKLPTRRAVIEAAMGIVTAGQARLVAVTMGHQGAILARAEGVTDCPAIQVEARSTVGAGDSFVAAMVFALCRGQSAVEAFHLGVAAGTAAVLHPGTGLAQADDIARLVLEIEAGR